MDHSRVPVLEALEEFRRRGDVAYGPPGHKQGRGADPRVAEIVGMDVFRSDVLSLNGLDDRRQSQGVPQRAEEPTADAVGAEHAFFSTCGSPASGSPPCTCPSPTSSNSNRPSCPATPSSDRPNRCPPSGPWAGSPPR
ncbi:hypothetical protein [Streptomyces sp. NRRL B-3648]|uniref:hypothetical protein n=1 Tax=Streptomyces sp. NRRL B-3648 TaxID=1519493 RepID=UPI001F31D6A3|nr:hypothetical protein [Streptomyces sp. NRRL B-3648]